MDYTADWLNGFLRRDHLELNDLVCEDGREAKTGGVVGQDVQIGLEMTVGQGRREVERHLAQANGDRFVPFVVHEEELGAFAEGSQLGGCEFVVPNANGAAKQ